jgi:hypothetical protein
VDRFLLHIANAVTLLATLAAVILLGLGLIDLMNGIAKAEIWLAILALAVVPYCFTGTLHRIVGISDRS